jgi:hypothetical protein
VGDDLTEHRLWVLTGHHRRDHVLHARLRWYGLYFGYGAVETAHLPADDVLARAQLPMGRQGVVRQRHESLRSLLRRVASPPRPDTVDQLLDVDRTILVLGGQLLRGGRRGGQALRTGRVLVEVVEDLLRPHRAHVNCPLESP